MFFDFQVQFYTLCASLKFECVYRCGDHFVLELDLEPFNAGFPRMTRPSSIGNGVQFLNRHLSSRLFRDGDSMEPLVEFMRLHKYKGQVR